MALIPEARSRGVRQILVTHGLGQQPSRAQLVEMAKQDAIIELVWLAVGNGEFSLADYAAAIRDIGAEHFLLSSSEEYAAALSALRDARAASDVRKR